MKRTVEKAAVFSLVLLIFSGKALAVPFYDSMTNATETGGLAGSTPDGSPGATQTWTSYWLAGGAYWLQSPNYGSYDTPSPRPARLIPPPTWAAS